MLCDNYSLLYYRFSVEDYHDIISDYSNNLSQYNISVKNSTLDISIYSAALILNFKIMDCHLDSTDSNIFDVDFHFLGIIDPSQKNKIRRWEIAILLILKAS